MYGGLRGSFVVALLLLLQPRTTELIAQNVDQEFAQALKLQQAGDFEGAVRGYQRFLKTHPDSIEANSNLGAVYARLGRFQEAIEQYTHALDLDGRNAAVRFNLGLAYYESAQIPKAAVQFERVISAQPDNERAAVLLADCRLRTGDPKKVIELLAPLEPANKGDRALLYLLGDRKS